MESWDSIPESERPFQLRLMELFAGFLEHVDVQIGRIIDELNRLGVRDNTIVFYIFGDNGASAEGSGDGQRASGPEQHPEHRRAAARSVEQSRRPRRSRGPKVDNMYHAGWAWAGDTPFKHTKLIASHFGGTRNPM